MVMPDAFLVEGLRRVSSRARHLFLSQFGCVSIPHELRQLGDMLVPS